MPRALGGGGQFIISEVPMYRWRLVMARVQVCTAGRVEVREGLQASS